MVSNVLAEPQALVAETLTRSPNRVWLASDHPLTQAGEVTLADCAGHDQVVLEADRIDAQHVDARRLRDELPTVDVGLVWRRGLALKPAADEFIETAREQARLRRA